MSSPRSRRGSRSCRGAGPRTVLLLGPTFTDHTVWADLLASPALQGTTDPSAHVDLRTPGIDPRTIALDGLTAVADYYTVDLADGDLASGAAQVAHVADRLAVLHPGPIVVVAHSTAGLVARQFAADHPDRVAGLVTLGTPHLGAPLPFLREPELGDAVRIAAVLVPQMAPSPLRSALVHLLSAVEGYLPAPAAGALDVAHPYPESAFSVTVPFDLGDIPVVTIGGGLAGDVLGELAAALADHLQALTAVARADPTHLSYGMSMPIALPGAVDGPAGTARVRFGLGQVALGAAAAPRPAELLRVELDLARADGWLVGGPGLSDRRRTAAPPPARRHLGGRGRRGRGDPRCDARPGRLARHDRRRGRAGRRQGGVAAGRRLRGGPRRQPDDRAHDRPGRRPDGDRPGRHRRRRCDQPGRRRLRRAAHRPGRLPRRPGARSAQPARRLGRPGRPAAPTVRTATHRPARRTTCSHGRRARPGAPGSRPPRRLRPRCGCRPTSTSRCPRSRLPSRSGRTSAWSRCGTGRWTAR